MVNTGEVKKPTLRAGQTTRMGTRVDPRNMRESYATLSCENVVFWWAYKISLSSSQISPVLKPKKSLGFIINPKTTLATLPCSLPPPSRFIRTQTLMNHRRLKHRPYPKTNQKLLKPSLHPPKPKFNNRNPKN